MQEYNVGAVINEALTNYFYSDIVLDVDGLATTAAAAAFDALESVQAPSSAVSSTVSSTLSGHLGGHLSGHHHHQLQRSLKAHGDAFPLPQRELFGALAAAASEPKRKSDPLRKIRHAMDVCLVQLALLAPLHRESLLSLLRRRDCCGFSELRPTPEQCEQLLEETVLVTEKCIDGVLNEEAQRLEHARVVFAMLEVYFCMRQRICGHASRLSAAEADQQATCGLEAPLTPWAKKLIPLWRHAGKVLKAGTFADSEGLFEAMRGVMRAAGFAASEGARVPLKELLSQAPIVAWCAASDDAASDDAASEDAASDDTTDDTAASRPFRAARHLLFGLRLMLNEKCCADLVDEDAPTMVTWAISRLLSLQHVNTFAARLLDRCLDSVERCLRQPRARASRRISRHTAGLRVTSGSSGAADRQLCDDVLKLLGQDNMFLQLMRDRLSRIDDRRRNELPVTAVEHAAYVWQCLLRVVAQHMEASHCAPFALSDVGPGGAAPSATSPDGAADCSTSSAFSGGTQPTRAPFSKGALAVLRREAARTLKQQIERITQQQRGGARRQHGGGAQSLTRRMLLLAVLLVGLGARLHSLSAPEAPDVLGLGSLKRPHDQVVPQQDVLLGENNDDDQISEGALRGELLAELCAPQWTQPLPDLVVNMARLVGDFFGARSLEFAPPLSGVPVLADVVFDALFDLLCADRLLSRPFDLLPVLPEERGRYYAHRQRRQQEKKQEEEKQQEKKQQQKQQQQQQQQREGEEEDRLSLVDSMLYQVVMAPRAEDRRCAYATASAAVKGTARGATAGPGGHGHGPGPGQTGHGHGQTGRRKGGKRRRRRGQRGVSAAAHSSSLAAQWSSALSALAKVSNAPCVELWPDAVDVPAVQRRMALVVAGTCSRELQRMLRMHVRPSDRGNEKAEKLAARRVAALCQLLARQLRLAWETLGTCGERLCERVHYTYELTRGLPHRLTLDVSAQLHALVAALHARGANLLSVAQFEAALEDGAVGHVGWCWLPRPGDKAQALLRGRDEGCIRAAHGAPGGHACSAGCCAAHGMSAAAITAAAISATTGGYNMNVGTLVTTQSSAITGDGASGNHTGHVANPNNNSNNSNMSASKRKRRRKKQKKLIATAQAVAHESTSTLSDLSLPSPLQDTSEDSLRRQTDCTRALPMPLSLRLVDPVLVLSLGAANKVLLRKDVELPEEREHETGEGPSTALRFRSVRQVFAPAVTPTAPPFLPVDVGSDLHAALSRQVSSDDVSVDVTVSVGDDTTDRTDDRTDDATGGTTGATCDTRRLQQRRLAQQQEWRRLRLLFQSVGGLRVLCDPLLSLRGCVVLADAAVRDICSPQAPETSLLASALRRLACLCEDMLSAALRSTEDFHRQLRAHRADAATLCAVAETALDLREYARAMCRADGSKLASSQAQWSPMQIDVLTIRLATCFFALLPVIDVACFGTSHGTSAADDATLRARLLAALDKPWQQLMRAGDDGDSDSKKNNNRKNNNTGGGKGPRGLDSTAFGRVLLSILFSATAAHTQLSRQQMTAFQRCRHVAMALTRLQGMTKEAFGESLQLRGVREVCHVVLRGDSAHVPSDTRLVRPTLLLPLALLKQHRAELKLQAAAAARRVLRTIERSHRLEQSRQAKAQKKKAAAVSDRSSDRTDRSDDQSDRSDDQDGDRDDDQTADHTDNTDDSESDSEDALEQLVRRRTRHRAAARTPSASARRPSARTAPAAAAARGGARSHSGTRRKNAAAVREYTTLDEAVAQSENRKALVRTFARQWPQVLVEVLRRRRVWDESVRLVCQAVAGDDCYGLRDVLVKRVAATVFELDGKKEEKEAPLSAEQQLALAVVLLGDRADYVDAAENNNNNNNNSSSGGGPFVPFAKALAFVQRVLAFPADGGNNNSSQRNSNGSQKNNNQNNNCGNLARLLRCACLSDGAIRGVKKILRLARRGAYMVAHTSHVPLAVSLADSLRDESFRAHALFASLLAAALAGLASAKSGASPRVSAAALHRIRRAVAKSLHKNIDVVASALLQEHQHGPEAVLRELCRLSEWRSLLPALLQHAKSPKYDAAVLSRLRREVASLNKSAALSTKTASARTAAGKMAVSARTAPTGNKKSARQKVRSKSHEERPPFERAPQPPKRTPKKTRRVLPPQVLEMPPAVPMFAHASPLFEAASPSVSPSVASPSVASPVPAVGSPPVLGHVGSPVPGGDMWSSQYASLHLPVPSMPPPQVPSFQSVDALFAPTSTFQPGQPPFVPPMEETTHVHMRSVATGTGTGTNSNSSNDNADSSNNTGSFPSSVIDFVSKLVDDPGSP